MFIDWELKRNHCNCHPETCCCKPWVLLKNGERHSTFFDQGKGLEILNALLGIEIYKAKEK